jgi:hypothetical protein
MKICNTCKQELPVKDFYVHVAMKDGRLSVCKECVKSRVKKRYQTVPEKIKAYEKSRGKLPHRKAASKAYQASHPELMRKLKSESQKRHPEPRQAYIKRNPEKRKAHDAVASAIRDGRLMRPEVCQRCGARSRIQAHHADYAEPLEVMWLCVRCHVGEHST